MAMNFTVNLAKQMVEIKIGDNVIERKIKVDDEGHQFFYVPNLMHTPSSSRINQLFTNRIKDAAETIKNGDGDVLCVSNLFSTINVLYFLDRNYGSILREEFLKGWEDVKFSYAITCGNTSTLDTDDNFSSSTNTTHYFDTEIEANNYLSNLKNYALQYAKKYQSLTENKQSSFWLENSFPDAIENLILYELERIGNPNIACPLCVVQIVRKE